MHVVCIAIITTTGSGITGGIVTRSSVGWPNASSLANTALSSFFIMAFFHFRRFAANRRRARSAADEVK